MRRSRQYALAFARLLLAFVIVAGIVHSGARYFYCEALGLAADDPCLQASDDKVASCPTEALHDRRVDCCEVITLASIPNGAHSESPSVPPAGVLAVVSADWYVDRARDDEPRSRTLSFERWRVPPRSALEARARLMVFLT